MRITYTSNRSTRSIVACSNFDGPTPLDPTLEYYRLADSQGLSFALVCVVREKYSVPFGKRVAFREYLWRPKKRRRRIVKVEIGTPVSVPGSDWGCRLRITGLPTKFDQGIFGIDAVQALELALVVAGSTVASFVKSRAGRIELWGGPAHDAFDLHLPATQLDSKRY